MQVQGWYPFCPRLGAALGQENSMEVNRARRQVDPRVYVPQRVGPKFGEQ